MKTEERKSPQTLFTDMDKKLLHEAIVKVLSPDEVDLITLVFWKNVLLHEIAELNSTSLGSLQMQLNDALKKIKTFCLNQPEFSRSSNRTQLAA